MVKVTFLGTSGSLPTKKRNQIAIHLKFKDRSILWDCGEGTQRQMTKTNISPYKIDEIYITHLHPDHFIGLWGLIRSLEFMGREKELNIYGTRGIKSYVDMFKGGRKTSLNFPVKVKEIEEGTLQEREDYKIEAFPVNHDTPTYGFIFQEKPGINLDKDKLKELNLLNHLKCSELKEKGQIEHEGRKITLEEVAKPKRKGKKIVYSGDTRPCESLKEAAEDADLLIVDSSFGKDKKKKAKDYMHGEAGEMAELANRANVDKLVLTHFSNRYDDESILEEEAREIFENSIASQDLMKIEV